jgi:hypothetical protein
MTTLDRIAPAFIEMAHSIVWASVATVDADSRPRSRILHPIWEWDGTDLFGWIATVPTRVKREHLAVHPEMSVNYWAPGLRSRVHSGAGTSCSGSRQSLQERVGQQGELLP